MNLKITQDFKNRKRWAKSQAKALRPTLASVYNVMKPMVRYSVQDIMRLTGLNRPTAYPRLTELDRKFLISKYSEENDVADSQIYYVRNI